MIHDTQEVYLFFIRLLLLFFGVLHFLHRHFTLLPLLKIARRINSSVPAMPHLLLDLQFLLHNAIRYKVSDWGRVAATLGLLPCFLFLLNSSCAPSDAALTCGKLGRRFFIISRSRRASRTSFSCFGAN